MALQRLRQHAGAEARAERCVLTSSTLRDGLGTPWDPWVLLVRRPLALRRLAARPRRHRRRCRSVHLGHPHLDNRRRARSRSVDGHLRPVPAGDRGDDLVLCIGSRATALQSTIEGGPGGTPNGRDGVPSIVDATSTFAVYPSARPTSFELRGIHTRGGSADFVVLGAAMSPTVLLFSYRADIVPPEPIAFGSMLAAPPDRAAAGSCSRMSCTRSAKDCGP